MKKGKRFLRSLTALVCMRVLLTVDTAPAMAAKVTQADIDALKGSALDLDKKQKEIQSKLNDLKDDKAAALQKKNLLDQQIANTTSQISNTESQITDYNALILQAEDELADAEQREADQYDLFCKRVREMEEQGTVSYWAVLFKATSFSDLLGRLDIVNEVMDYDQKVIDDLEALQAEIEEKKTGLEASKADLEAAKASLESQKRQLSSQRDEANKLVREIDDNAAEYQATLKDLEAEERRIEQQVKQLQKQLEEQMAAEGKNYNTNPGGYIWPVNGGYISCPIWGYSGHTGTDIAAPAGTTIWASKGGTVAYAGWSNGYGYNVLINHGDGTKTRYAHCSSLAVYTGQQVSQGQVVGYVGQTGWASGNHCHFEIISNGTFLDARNYIGYSR